AALPLHAPATTDASLHGVSSRLGAMTVDFEMPRRFDRQDRDFLETLAAMVARAIERCQLLERLQQTLARSEEEGLRSRLATQAAGMGSWDVDLSTDLMYCNARMYELFGLPAGEGREPLARFMSLVHPDDRGAVADAMRQAQEADADFEHSFRVVVKGDAVRWLLARGRMLREPGRPAMRMLGHTLDITPLVRARQALETADRHKDEFLATVSHELRNPLGPILNAATMLARAGDRAEVRSMAVPLIQRQIKQMTHLIDDLLELSRIRHGRIVLQRAPVDALQAVHDALEAVRPALDKAGHRLALRPADEAVRVDADAPRLTQVLSNLLHNACKYTPAGGLIEVEIEREAGQGVIRVSDNGVGIAPELLPRVFELFVQDRHDRDRADGGLGLGLALVKRLVELHGGSVEVSSAGRGQGASFTLRLPLANPPDAVDVSRAAGS
ncbi:MAG: ATP-binding protein, partial [Burkholderiaceae bacterium]